jgi:hypothetical protein
MSGRRTVEVTYDRHVATLSIEGDAIHSGTSKEFSNFEL